MDTKNILITGASSGFGKEIALLLHSKGYNVFGTSRNPRSRYMDGIRMLKLDVTSDASVRKCVSAVLKESKGIDVLINNAGYALMGALEEASMQEARLQFETNFFGAVRMVNAVLPSMRRQRHGHIINISSLAALVPSPFEGYYAASKAALLSYSEALYHELMSLGICVCVVEPGFFSTNLGNLILGSRKRIHGYDAQREILAPRFGSSVKNGQDPRVLAMAVLRVRRHQNFF